MERNGIVTKENRFILPKQTKVTLTQNGVRKVDVTVNASVSTGKEVDFAKDAINVTSTMVINDYTIEIQKASYKAGKSANAKATISKNRETLITISGSALGTVTTTGEGSSVGKTSISVNILNRAKIVANIDDVELLNHNLDRLLTATQIEISSIDICLMPTDYLMVIYILKIVQTVRLRYIINQ